MAFRVMDLLPAVSIYSVTFCVASDMVRPETSISPI